MHPIEPLESRRLLTVYYVDAQGSDANTGLDPAAAFQSIGKVNALNLTPGDSVLFDAADTFPGTLTLDARDAGSPAAPVTISSFGNGRATLAAGAGNGIAALNTAGVDINNLRFTGAGQAPQQASGIKFDNNLPGNAKLAYVRISDVEVSGFGKYGITVGGSNAKAGFDDVRIERADVHGNLLGGIETHGVFSASATAYANTNVYVGHSTVHDNPGYAGSPNHSGDGIVLSDADNVLIERNVAYANGGANTHVGGPVGIWVWDVNRATIQYNESHHNQTSSTADGGGFDLDGGVTNSVIQYNYSHDNAGPGYGVFQFSGARPFHDNTLRYNVSANDARKNNYGAIAFWNGGSGISNVDVDNNTVYLAPSGATTPKAIQFQSATTNVHVRNNIFQTVGGVTIADIQGKQSGLLFQGNDYWSSGASFKLKSSTKIYASVAAWSSATGYEKIATTYVGLQLDPLLTAPAVPPTLGNADLLESMTPYRLTANSPLVNRGLNLFSRFNINPGPRDLDGTALPQTSGDAASFLYDIGADEYA